MFRTKQQPGTALMLVDDVVAVANQPIEGIELRLIIVLATVQAVEI